MQTKRLKLKQLWTEIRWILIMAAWLLSLSLGYIGFTLYSADSALSLTITERIYRTIQLIGLESGAMESAPNLALEISRFLLPGLTAFTALQALSILFREQTQWLHLWRLKDHCIVCGLGRKGTYFVNDLLANGQKLVVIDKDIDAVSANNFRRRGAIVLNGDATEPETLLSARITKSKNLVSLLGGDQENLKIAHMAYQLSKNYQKELTCIIHLASQDLLGLVKRSELNLSASDPFMFTTFNTYHMAASQIIQRDSDWRSETNLPQHILLIGMGRLGQNLIQQAGYKWFTLNQKEKLTVTVVDIDAEGKVQSLIDRQPELLDVVNFQAISIDLNTPKSLNAVLYRIDALDSISRAYLCISNAILSLKILLALRESHPFTHIPFFVRIEKTSGLADLFKTPIVGLSDVGELHLFDIYEDTCSVDLVMGGIHERLARQLRENYLLNQNTPEAEALLALEWDKISKGEKEANREQANRIYQLLESRNYRLAPRQDWDARNFSFSDGEVEMMAKLEHQLWCQWKHTNGWQYGTRRDDQLKTNPDLIPWEELPQNERKKNTDFIRCLPTLLADIGFQILHKPPNHNEKN